MELAEPGLKTLVVRPSKGKSLKLATNFTPLGDMEFTISVHVPHSWPNVQSWHLFTGPQGETTANLATGLK